MSITQSYFAHPTAIIEEGCLIGEGTRIWHFCHIMPGAKIGKNCSLGQNVVMMPGSAIGNNVKVQNNVSIYTGVYCEDDVFLGPSMVFTNVINPRSAIERKSEFQITYVAKGATIGANATIICGHSLGQYCLIGAGSVVTKNVAPYALVVGNPGKQIGWVSKNGHRLLFGTDGRAQCPESGEFYLLVNNNVELLTDVNIRPPL